MWIPSIIKTKSAKNYQKITSSLRESCQPHTHYRPIQTKQAFDDNKFDIELTAVEENSFNLHRQAGRLLFKLEENPIAKLHSFARNDSLFEDGQAIHVLQKQIKYCLENNFSKANEVYVLSPDWENAPFDTAVFKDEKQQHYLVLPEIAKQRQLGKFLVSKISVKRNTIRFIMPSADCNKLPT
ncbi:MAG: hypothetical protein FWE67_15745 [Planctomycetaceae bacterium]|nr:hypothetical protein [Planctomycetaceae bacterium]